jgi:hypothetical protein
MDITSVLNTKEVGTGRVLIVFLIYLRQENHDPKHEVSLYNGLDEGSDDSGDDD